MSKEWHDSPVDGSSEFNALQLLEKERILNIMTNMFGFERTEMVAIVASGKVNSPYKKDDIEKMSKERHKLVKGSFK